MFFAVYSIEDEYEKLPEIYKTPQVINPPQRRRVSTTSVENADIMIRILFGSSGSTNDYFTHTDAAVASDTVKQRRFRIKTMGSKIKRKLSFRNHHLTDHQVDPGVIRRQQLPPVERRRRASLLAVSNGPKMVSARPCVLERLACERERSQSDGVTVRPRFVPPPRRRVGISFSKDGNSGSPVVLSKFRHKTSSEFASDPQVSYA